ncbi:MAG: hypothetical protein AB8B97_04050 [Granulosicoccus sp.]
MNALVGDDVVCAGGGNDIVLGVGTDTLNGEGGNETANGYELTLSVAAQ